ncbi:hypothetical protein LTR13_004872 [Exophiala sideris]|nr:hypothetical protein LTR13_004872 [Exophiala sideris]KAK5182225.1 hypothetical protein LTR44_005236 [Eurotiomycetes sp. CCFEE 6388]
MEAASTTTTPTISVIVNEVFALGLPCADNPNEKHSGLSTGAKAGIGVGVGVAALLLILALWACIAVRHHRRAKMRKLEPANAASVDPKHMSVATTLAPGSPNLQQRNDPMGHYGLAGYAQPHGYTPAFGYMQAQSAHDTYGNYGIHPVPVGMPMHMPGPQGYNGIPPPESQSPPPMYPQYKDIPEVDGTSVVPKPAHQEDVQILEHLSDTRSQESMTDRTAINGFSGNMGQAAELSSDGMFSRTWIRPTCGQLISLIRCLQKAGMIASPMLNFDPSMSASQFHVTDLPPKVAESEA